MSNVIDDVSERINIFHMCTYKSLVFVAKTLEIISFLIIKPMDCCYRCAIWQLILGCLLMRTIASFLRYTGYLNFLNGLISRVLLLILVHVQTELSILLTSCLTAIKNHVIKYCTTVYVRNGKNLFWSIKNSGKILNKLKYRGFLASCLSNYDFSTLYTLLPHNLIKEKLTELIEQTFNREGSLYLACNDRNAFLLLSNLNDINCGHVRKCVMRSIIFWTIYL